MTRDTYDEYHALKRRKGKHESGTLFESDSKYKPKHEKKWYNVWRVLGPAGPEECFPVYGLDEAREAIKGCWDYEVTTTNMEVVNI